MITITTLKKEHLKIFIIYSTMYVFMIELHINIVEYKNKVHIILYIYLLTKINF